MKSSEAEASAQPSTKLHALLHSFDGRLRIFIDQTLPAKLRKHISVEDILQDTYFQAFRKLNDFIEISNAASYGWLETIARNVIYNHHEAQQAQRRGAGQKALDGDVARILAEYILYTRTPSRSAMSHETVLTVQQCIARLSSDYQQAIQLRFMQGLAVNEVARQMGKTAPAVWMLCQRATKALRMEIESTSPQLFTGYIGMEISASDNQLRAREIAIDIAAQREAGAEIDDSKLFDLYPDIYDILKSELAIAERISAQRWTAQRFEPTDSVSDQLDEREPGGRANTNLVAETDSPRNLAIPGYLIRERIGVGGQAEVFKAVQRTTGRTVAVKVLKDGPFASSALRNRFDREARILSTLNHPNIVSILERGRADDGSFFLVMPFIEGLELDAYCAGIHNDHHKLKTIVRLFVKVSDAISSAHQAGVIHRDLKPSNIVVDHRGEPHILDFGLARVDRSVLQGQFTLTSPGQLFGSLPWSSPEQASGDGKELDARTDIYSLGIILYRSIANSLPYPLNGPLDQVLAHIRKTIPSAPSSSKHCCRGVGANLDGVVLRTLQKLPDNRYASCDELRDALQAWVDGRLKAVKPRRWRSKAVIAGTLLLTATTYAWFQSPVSRPPARPLIRPMAAFINKSNIEMVGIMNDPVKAASGRINDVLRFHISAFPITQSQFANVMQSNPSDERWRGDGIPVVNVSFFDAQEFCRRLSALEHRRYRLPTEEEWDLASTAPTFFDESDFQNAETWSLENSGGRIHPAGEKKSNSFGVSDIGGNIREWCDTKYSRYKTDPVPATPQMVVRGGSALLSNATDNLLKRQPWDPMIKLPDLGFRITCDEIRSSPN